MKIAVLMSTYNGQKFLNEQLKSLAEQTVKENMVVYIRDDGSKEDTFGIINKWKDRLHIVLYKECNAGPALSFWNLLMNPEIQADYYAFCDQDDIWDSDKIQVAIEKLSNKVCLYACNCRIVNEYGQVVREQRIEQPPIINIPRLFVSGCTQGCSMIFTDSLRQYLMKLKVQCIPMHDVVLMLYAIGYGEIYWDQAPHFSYRVHSNNVVAKENKSIFKNLKTTYWNWKNSSEHSMGTVACELLNKGKSFSDEEVSYLTAMCNYRNSIKNKLKILDIKNKTDKNKKAIRSYRIRVILNLL